MLYLGAALALATTPATDVAMAQERAVPQSRADVQLSYAPVVKSVSPAVVNVYASRVVQQRPRGFPFDDPIFRQFFGNSPLAVPRERVQRALGSGVIVSADGTVVTNVHVIDGATEIKVALADRREFEAEVVIRDERSDIAVLRIKDGEDFPFIELSDSDALEVGDLVLAIGNPYGLGQTVTSGIVSALRRVELRSNDQRVYIQTDAAINQGNSGGALTDMRGRLVGINTAIFSRSGGSDGIGFAVPVNVVRQVIEAAEDGEERVKRPWLGATLQSVTPDIATSLGIERPSGVLVSDLVRGGPAEAAGLRVGDIIVTIADQQIETLEDFGYRFSTRPIGGSVPITFIRDGETQNVALSLVPAPETPARDERLLDGNGPVTGATVLNMSPAVAEELGLETAGSGVIVAKVAEGSVAQRIGLKEGDRIKALNDREIDSTRTLEAVNARRDRIWSLTIQRGDQVLTQSFRS
ncbi:serine endoprotease DegQ [Agaricicola taiwanensis]|uniref:Serine endoprotease DegQ n=2 Tax=Agaricicola taiwanensis TaxID=591372 RepID=A0A8J3DVD1_9RHOB|nr:serine endoprotease DegQ [Agaricicola taiwanensis]